MNVQEWDKNNILEILTNCGPQRYVEKGTLKLLPINLHKKNLYGRFLSFKDV